MAMDKPYQSPTNGSKIKKVLVLINGNIIYVSVLSISKKQHVPRIHGPSAIFGNSMVLSPKHFGWAARVVLYKANVPSHGHRLHANDQSKGYRTCTQLTKRVRDFRSLLLRFSLQHCKTLSLRRIYIYIYTYI